jgi:AsmA protein
VKPIIKIVSGVAVLLLISVIAIPLLVNVNNFRPQIESSLGSALGRPVKVGNLSLSVFSGSVGADQLSIADDPKFSTSPFIQAKSLRVGVELLPLIFSKQLSVTNLQIEHPEISLMRNREGVWNFSSLGGPSAPPKPASKSSGSPSNIDVARLQLSNGTITVTSLSGKRKPIVYSNVNVAVRNFSFTRAFPVVASAELPGGGSLKIDGTAGPVNSSDAALTPLQAKINLKKLDLAQSAFVDPALGITGTADFDGTVASDGRTAKAAGTLRTTALKVVPKGIPSAVPIQFVFAVEHNMQTETGKVMQGEIAIGKALAKLTGTYDMHGEITSIQTKLNGQAMPVDDLEAVLPAVGVILPSGSQLKGGSLSLELESSGPLDKSVSAGWIKMSNTQLAGFNLGSKLSAISALTGSKTNNNDTSIQNLSCDVRYTPEGTRLDKINLVIPALGTVTGAGTVSPDQALDFKMVASLEGGVAGGLSKVAGAGSGGIPVSVGGTTSNPTFAPDLKGIVGGQLKGLLQGGENANPLGGLGGLFGKKKP